MTKPRKWLIQALAVLVVGLAAGIAWQQYASRDREAGLVSGNGRIEAVEIDVAARAAGRVEEILVREGDFVTAGQALALMDTEVLAAQLRQAEAQLQQAHSAVATAASHLAQRESDKAAAQAEVAQRDVELRTARTHLARSMALSNKGFLSPQAVDDERARVESAGATVRAARAQVAAMQSAIASARSQVAGAQSSTAAAQANIERIQADIDDTTLKSPRDGRVQFIVARPGEVIPAGGRVLNMVDLSDVYMTFFLPTAVAGSVAIGSEVRIVLDAAPQYVIPASVSFISDVAQFTPKTVETASEREKLMFRVRAQIPPDLLRKHIKQVKTGLPGTAYVLLNTGAGWPARLQVKLPDAPARSSR
ncbi:MAG: HlyD family efflux transporter periplasmic adaptor subunit [Thiobacillus sp.]|jgi:HlyD family secretion protein|uniref:HlyD family secretion protein n=1 Tax=Thiobacillus sp. TaxID=924 RepID=UPI0028961814|nr:HlyD family efflux transporter periplasmic adaptor subunit [Thiobacillus sp.]MDT3707620.1 HlyD family efflux transporter periplasmic adaptor subunit [Thiobacillus sp.]